MLGMNFVSSNSLTLMLMLLFTFSISALHLTETPKPQSSMPEVHIRKNLIRLSAGQRQQYFWCLKLLNVLPGFPG